MTKLNLLLQLQQQKLLAENKERAGHNRSAKEDRSRTTKTADKASNPPATSPAAQAQQAEDARKKKELSGGSLNLHKRRRPAATGSEEDFRFFGIINRLPFVLPNSTVSFSGEWTATAESEADYRAGTYEASALQYKIFYSAEQRTNSYEYNTSVVGPKFYEELGESEKQYINMSEVQVPFSLQYIHWTLDQASAPGGFTTNAVYGTPPVLSPALFSQFSLFRRLRSAAGYDIPYILRSDGRYIYYSIAVQTAKTTKSSDYLVTGTHDFDSFYKSLASGGPTVGRDVFYLVGPDFSTLGDARLVYFNEGETYVITGGVNIQLRPAIRGLYVYEYEFGFGYPDYPGGGSGRNINSSLGWNGTVWNYSQPYWNPTTQNLVPGSAQTDVDIQGLYWRYDTEAEDPAAAISFRQVDLSNLGETYATRKSPLSNYFDNQDSSNPIRIIWEYKKSLNTTNLPLPDLAEYFIYTNQNTLTIESYPERFVYNQSTGIATEVLGTDVYTIELAANLSYEVAASTAKNTPKSEWEQSTTYTLDYPDSNFPIFAHVPT